MKTYRPTLLLILLVAVPLSVAFAHDTWLMPDKFEVQPNGAVTLDLTSGMKFPELESGPKRERVQAAVCRLAGHTLDITDISSGRQSLIFKTTLREPGVAALWIKLPPRDIELKAEEVKEYLDEIDAPESVRAEWGKMQPQRWRERYTKHPKTFVRVGDPKGDRSWAEPVGMDLEIIPEQDPTALRAADEFQVRVLKAGKPHPNFALNAVAGGEAKGETKRTDAEGRVRFRFEKAGPWLLRGTDVRRSTKANADWESDFATLTVAVKDR